MKKLSVSLLLVLALCLGMIVPALAGDTSVLNTDAAYPVVKQPLTLKMFSVKAPIHGPWEQMPYFTEMEAKTGIRWEFDLASQDSAKERKGIVLASGDYPDVFFGTDLTDEELMNYGSQGALIDLTALIDAYMPNLKALLEANPALRALITSADGSIYALPYYTCVPRDVANGKLWINTEWLKAVGLEMPKTLDEYYEALKAFKEKDPNGNGQADELPLAFAKDGNTLVKQLRVAILPALGIVTSNGNERLYLDDAGKVHYIFASPAYKEYLAFMNKLYNEGLIDPESFTQTGSQLVAKGNQTLVGSFSNLASYLMDTMEHYTYYAAIPPMTSALNDQQIWNKNFVGNIGTYAITSACKYPEAAARWADYFYSFEGGVFTSQGPEDLGWKYDDDARTLWSKIVPEKFATSEEFRGTITPNCGLMTPAYIPPEFLLGLNAKHVLNLEENVATAYTPYLKDGFPRVKLGVDEQLEVGVIITDLDKYMEESEARFITGDLSLDKWDEYVANIQKMSLGRYLEIYQSAYDAYAAAMK